jgi:hypothetical protein
MELCAIGALEVAPEALAGFTDRAADLAARLKQRERGVLRTLVRNVRVHPDRLEVDCDAAAVAGALGAKPGASSDSTLNFACDVRLQRSGRAVRLVQTNGALLDTLPSASLLKLVVKARRWWRVLQAGESDITRLAAVEGVTPSYLTRVVRLAFLSPAMVEAVLAGSLRAEVDGEMLTATGAMQPCWREQARLLLPA